MKTKVHRLFIALALLAISILNPHFCTAFAQGALTPPGAPAPTMKSLDQIEARTPITNTASLKTLSQPGSYYLTGNLTVSTGDGINITANNVTLDLNGFTIASTFASASGFGIKIASGLSDITIVNGHILGGVTNNGSGVYGGGGFNYGIYFATGIEPQNVVVSRVSVSGCMIHGIYLGLGNSAVVEACTVRTVGSEGIYAGTVKNCSALDCGGDGIYGDQVSDCRGQSTGSGDGLYSTVIALNCSGYGSSGAGLNAYSAENCYGYSSSGDGLDANNALNCNGYNSGSGYGIYASNMQNCSGQSSAGTGLSAFTAQNCFGVCTGGIGSSYGLIATTALNCDGQSNSGTGLICQTAQNCSGQSNSGTGLVANATAIGCSGFSSSGTGLSAFIANVCHGATGSGTTLSVTHNVNSF
jgi:hypothetical protein